MPEPIYFTWRDGDDKTRHLGFMGDHLPDIAKAGDGGVYTGAVTAILCGAAKQVKVSYDATIRQLSEENKQIKEELRQLREQLEKRH